MKRVCIIGAGASGLAAAWVLGQHPDRFEFEIFERNEHFGGNAITVDIPQDDGSAVPVDISVTAFIPSVYQNYVELMKRFKIESKPTQFSYSVSYGKGIYAHDFDSELKRELQPEIDKFQRLLSVLKRFNVLNRQPSVALSFFNPFNFISMKHVLNAAGLSSAFRCKVLKPMFVNFVLATNVFDMPASMFARYLDFFDIEHATPMVTWDQGTRNIYRHMIAEFGEERLHLSRGIERIERDKNGITVIDEHGLSERFDELILACNANQVLMLLDKPSTLEQILLGSVRYESELHNHAIVHTDGSVLPDNETRPMETRSNYIIQYGARPDNYEITYIMHNQQPWAKGSDKPCLVTYNPIQPIAEGSIVKRWWFQHCVHDVFHTVVLMNTLPFLQGKRHTWYCGGHTLANSQEHCFISGVAAATQLGADYPFQHNPQARKWFNFYGRLVHGLRFRPVRNMMETSESL